MGEDAPTTARESGGGNAGIRLCSSRAGETRPLLPHNSHRRAAASPPPRTDDDRSRVDTEASCLRGRSISSATAAAATFLLVAAVYAAAIAFGGAGSGFDRHREVVVPAVDDASATRVVPVHQRLAREASESSASSLPALTRMFRCPAGVETVRADRPSFPSFLQSSNMEHENRANNENDPPHPKKPIKVTYDARSIRLDGRPVLFLGGSVHPVRTTQSTWSAALDEAVRNGLNMITVYTFWSYHQPSQHGGYDWSLPSGVGSDSDEDDDDSNTRWELADALREAACRGLFVHMRIGPYECAEYNYGGIPEWVPLMANDDGSPMQMRRWDEAWMGAMTNWIGNVTGYLSENELWASQGGPIVMGQIENELGGQGGTYMAATSDEAASPNRKRVNAGDNRTVQDYADWCGALAAKHSPPSTLWTMCNGLTAPNAVNTCNGNYCDDWLSNHGQTDRVQVDQPALWTEDEGGYQVWGESPAHPRDYFWGRTARDDARAGMHWFARGGSHLNHYMWWGGYNRGRAASANVMNGYATDAPLCSDGQRRHPKFEHLGAFHEAVASVAGAILGSPTALGREAKLEYRDAEDGTWKIGTQQRMFVYGGNESERVVFAENDAKVALDVRLPADTDDGLVLSMNPFSSVLIVDGAVAFDSSSIDPAFKSYQRKTVPSSEPLGDWHYGQEESGASNSDPLTVVGDHPLEYAALMNATNVYTSDYAWYETTFLNGFTLPHAALTIEARGAMAISVFLDGVYQGGAVDYVHMEGPVVFTVDLVSVPLHAREHSLSILTESLGYHKLVGRWGAGTSAKIKGLGPAITLKGGGGAVSYTQQLGENRKWRSRIGLHGEVGGRNGHPNKAVAVSGRTHGLGFDFGSIRHSPPMAQTIRSALRKLGAVIRANDDSAGPIPTPPCSWAITEFHTPAEVLDPAGASSKALMLDVTAGRGHLWLNGVDLGRYWNVTRNSGGGDTTSSSTGGEEEDYSQRYYHLPRDVLRRDGVANELALFNSMEGDLSKMRLVTTWTEPTTGMEMEDEVDFPNACL